MLHALTTDLNSDLQALGVNREKFESKSLILKN